MFEEVIPISLNSEFTSKLALEFSKTIEMFNLSSLDARLYVYLFFANKPKTLDEMSEALDKSKTTMSTSARNLHDKNVITLVWQKGVRKDLYAANTDLFKIFMELQLKKWNASIEYQKGVIQQINHAFQQTDESSTDNQLNQQMAHIIQFHEQINDFINQAIDG